MGALGDFFSGVGDFVGDAYGWLSSNKGDTQANKDRDEILNPFLNRGNPYINTQMQPGQQQGNYNALISMLTQRANGQGPSLAMDAYRTASDNAMAQQMALGNSGNPAAARQAAMNLGNIQQGMASGLSNARNQEMVSAAGQLGGAIGAADQSLLARDQMGYNRERANQEAWLELMRQRMGLTKGQMQGKSNMDQVGGIGQGIGQMLAFLG